MSDALRNRLASVKAALRWYPIIALALVAALVASCRGSGSGPAPTPPTSISPATPTQPQPPAMPPSSVAPPQAPADRLVEGYAVLKGCRMTLEVADTPAKRSRGLMERPSLPRDHGMLFVYDELRAWPFWMLNTLIPLDIAWLDKSGRVVDVQTMLPQPGVSPDKLTFYYPKGEAQSAIEMNAGLAGELGLTKGDAIELRLGARAIAPLAAPCG